MYRKRPAFTLFEMLMVVTILAVVSGAIIVAFGNTEQEAGWHVSQSEIGEIKKAILRFKQDMGYLPTTASPADFRFLYVDPVGKTWDPNTARGWRGPYLSNHGEGHVLVGHTIQSIAPLTYGYSPSAAGGGIPVDGVADPYLDSEGKPTFYTWQRFGSGAVPKRAGRPYLYFTYLDLTADPGLEPIEPCVVSMGANGVLDVVFVPMIVNGNPVIDPTSGKPKWEPVAPPTGSDDVVIYVLR